MKVLVLDNYDSFTYNLVHILRELGVGLDVYRNDQIGIDEVDQYDKILLSPGPGVPSEGGIMPELLDRYKDKKSILGVCLGHQAIGESFGGQLHNLSTVFHGIVTDIEVIKKDELFNGIPDKYKVCRYHSWVVSQEGFPEDMIITSQDSEGTIMSIKHAEFDVRGVQFHPESVMTEHGIQLMKNWIEL